MTWRGAGLFGLVVVSCLAIAAFGCGGRSNRGRRETARDTGPPEFDAGSGFDAGGPPPRFDAGRDAGFDAGPLCFEPLTECSGECVDTQSDTRNCGRCGFTCATGLRCVGGFCMETGPEVEGDLRLVGGTTPNSGRLEVFHNGIWGTICDDGFTDSGATVACRQLGFASGTQMCCAAYGSGSPTGTFDGIWMDDVYCTGSESRLDACPFLGMGTVDWSSRSGPTPNNCSHSEDVGVTCL